MDHIAFKATTTTTDQGVFEAVISTETADREQDIVSAEGMVTALRKWNRPLPLTWHHSTKAEDIFGHVDSQSARVEDGEVLVAGHVDLESKIGQEAWRSFKSRTVGFSFGYLILEAKEREGGGRHITQLDVFEATATPTPMNNDTRVLSTKAPVEELSEDQEAVEDASAEDPEPGKAKAQDSLRQRSEAMALEVASGGFTLRKPPTVRAPEPRPEPESAKALRLRCRDEMLQLLTGD